ncbi:hypothetical protein [Labrys sp. ZIDIC5]|uniref:hypothetical protein n=1 Tax=Labrys sedimenti TaxID=3106036 RepID=UPI002ACADB57|nr:hypothetical protein [Labrys sp. ZIDIC5]MDZ5448416.1 hypothetical protein [Labrys sp. ZIDIC5]
MSRMGVVRTGRSGARHVGRRSRLCVVVFGFAMAAGAAEAAPAIQWEVANRFPLFRSEDHFRALAAIYAGLPLADRQNQPVMALEVELEKRADARQLGKAFGDPATIWRFGWASALARGTCFSATNRGHWGCKLANGEDFVGARKTDILASVTEAPAGRQCQWLVNGTVAATAACDSAQIRLAGIPIATAFTLAVKADGLALTEAPDQTVRPITILGMGDSFASGEGNPDKAAVLGTDVNNFQESSHLPGESGWRGRLRLYPLRYKHNFDKSFGIGALWINQQCHRSLYSHQLKAALAIALEAPHASVTYLGYGCTGAEVFEGLLGYWVARDDVPKDRSGKSGQYDASPQVMRALRDLCPLPLRGYNRFSPPAHFSWDTDLKRCAAFKRKPDILLLSIGGNDIGFSRVIAGEALAAGSNFLSLRRTAERLWIKGARPITFQDATAAQSALGERYRILALAFEQFLGLTASQIIQTGYPQMLHTGSGTCLHAPSGEAGTAGMDLHEIFRISKPTTGPDSIAFVDGLNAKIHALGTGTGWQVVSDFAAAFKGHALCQPGMADGSNAPDGLRFPVSNPTGQRWTPFSPPAWQAYRPRQRWFVTPNDAFLAANTMRTLASSGGDPRMNGRAQPVLAATLSGSFHPNALGQAAMGDGVLKALRQKLGLPAPGAPAP